MLKLISCKGLLTLKEIEKIASNTIMWLSLTLKHSTKPFPKTILFLWSSISLLAATVLNMRLNTKRLELISRMKAQKWWLLQLIAVMSKKSQKDMVLKHIPHLRCSLRVKLSNTRESEKSKAWLTSTIKYLLPCFSSRQKSKISQNHSSPLLESTKTAHLTHSQLSFPPFPYITSLEILHSALNSTLKNQLKHTKEAANFRI